METKKENLAYSLAGFLLVVSGLSHISQLLLYEQSNIVLIASAFGVLYLILGLLSLMRIYWLPLIVVPICLFGLTMGTRRLLEGPFNVQFAAHQLIHLIVISLFFLVVIRRIRQRSGN